MRGEAGEIVKPQQSVAEKYAAILGVNESDIQNGRLYEFVDDWMGVPYKFGGQDKEGIDCSGLAQLLEQQVFNVSIPRSTREQINVIKREYEEDLKAGDLLFFDYDGRKFSHVGVYLQNGYYVHASSSRGVTITKLHDPYTYKYFSRCGSIMEDPNSAPGK
jgi:cell wall-associated NlpC family hydrolase